MRKTKESLRVSHSQSRVDSIVSEYKCKAVPLVQRARCLYDELNDDYLSVKICSNNFAI
jgi:hypothetical protein